MNPGANGRPDITGRSAEPAAHLAHAFLDNAFYSATPARVEHSDGTAFRIRENDRQAIGGQDREQNAGRLRDQAIAGERRFGTSAIQ